VLLHPVGSTGHVVHSGALGARIIAGLFFLIRWDRYGLHKKLTGIRYGELVFLLPVISVGGIVHSIVSGV
jgi:hypothetical protein